MTTPNQPAPTWMALLGLGAFQIGGSGGGSGLSSYGQGIDESFVNDLIYGPLAPKNLADNSGAVSDLIPVFQAMIAGVPIAVLKYLQPFIPGATDADFADSATAAAFITGTFIPKLIIETTNGINRLVKDLEILFDVFHVTYPAGTPTDPAGQTSWFAAWNDLLALIGISTGTTPTSPAPTIGSAITSAGTAGSNGSSWSTRLTNDLLVLLDVFHLTYTVTQWNAAWADLLALFGIVNSVTAPTNPTPTIGPAITSAQSSATTAGTNASTALTNAGTAQSWATRLTNDLTILLDVFHVTYTSTQWNNAWTDLMVLLGIVNSVSTPSNPSPTIGTAITSAQSSATTATTNAATAQTTANTGVTNAATAQTKANTASTWATRLTNNLLVLSDMFHLTYAAGSVSDPPGTLSGGKPTWYSCWNDLLSLTGTVNAVTAPTDAAPTTGTVIQANTATANTASTNASIAISNASAANTLAQGTVDNIYAASNGGSTTGNPVSSVVASLTAIPASNIVGAVGAQVTFGAAGAGGFTNASTASVVASWTHSIATTDLGVLVVITYWTNAPTPGSSVTYGGTAMTKVQSTTSAGTSLGQTMYIEAWWLKAPASGTKTVVATVTGGSGTNAVWLRGQSMSYLASKIGNTNFAVGSGSASLSQSISSNTNNMVVGAFMEDCNSTVTMSAFNKTSRYAGNVGGQACNIGDSAGATSTTFTATSSSSAITWIGLTVELSN